MNKFVDVSQYFLQFGVLHFFLLTINYFDKSIALKRFTKRYPVLKRIHKERIYLLLDNMALYQFSLALES